MLPICIFSTVPICPFIAPGSVELIVSESFNIRTPTSLAKRSDMKLVPAPVSKMKRYVFPLIITGIKIVVPRQPFGSTLVGSFTFSISIGTDTSQSGRVILGAGMLLNLL